MIPNYQDLNAKMSGVEASGEFKISTRHSAHIMKILRDQLYSDKKMAVLREYSANAWDANREAGNGDKPIKVTLPTNTDPTLTIRDYGPGISHEDMFEIFATYGESTKRKANGQVGMLGIGSKSGFAYTDSFTVTTWQDGIQRIYTAILDSGAGSINLLDASPSDEPTGTMIQIPVRPRDIPEFEYKAKLLFKYFKPRPDINTVLPPEPDPESILQNGTLCRGNGTWHAIMGCIAYKIDLSQLRGPGAYRGGAGEYLDRIDGLLYYNIGDIEIAASREGLEYSDKTKSALIDKFIDLTDEFIKDTMDKIESGDYTLWEKRCRAQILNDLSLPVPDIFKDLTNSKFFIGTPKTFTVTYGQKQTTVSWVYVRKNTRLIIRDENKHIDGYGLGDMDYVIRPKTDVNPRPTIDQVKEELLSIIEDKKVQGIPIINISSLQWSPRSKFRISKTKSVNKKHLVKTFVLKDVTGITSSYVGFSHPYSDHWNVETVSPTDDDVYVILKKFLVVDHPAYLPSTDFYRSYLRDLKISKALKQNMPKIYGYKTTDKNPVDLANIKGKPYSTWRIEFFKAMLTDPKVSYVYEAIRWVELIVRGRFYRSNSSKLDPDVVAKLFQELGRDHDICVLLRKAMAAKRTLKRVPYDVIQAVKEICGIIDEATPEDAEPIPQEALKRKIENTYPMFNVFGKLGIKVLFEDEGHLDKWIEYIKLVDRATKGLDNEQSTVVHDVGRVDHDRLEGQTLGSEERGPELQQSQECDQQSEGGRELGSDRGSPIGDQNSEGMVERQVSGGRRLGDLLRAASS